MVWVAFIVLLKYWKMKISNDIFYKSIIKSLKETDLVFWSRLSFRDLGDG